MDALLARPLDAVLPEAERVREDAEAVDELDTLRVAGSGRVRASSVRVAVRVGAVEMEGGKSGAAASRAFSVGTTFSFARADVGRFSRLSICTGSRDQRIITPKRQRAHTRHVQIVMLLAYVRPPRR